MVVRCNEFSTRATKLRIVFQGVEAMLAYDMGPGVMRSHTSPLFSVRQVLWKKSDENDVLHARMTYKFLFTIQMPMIQFPPSMNTDYYRCNFKLSAYLDPSFGYGEIPVMTQIHIKYIPLTETRLLKTPIYLQDLKKRKNLNFVTPNITASVKLNSMEYLSGSTIRATICVTRKSNNNNHGITTTTSISPSSPSAVNTIADLSITMYLYQISKFNLDAEPISEELVVTQTHIIKNNKNFNMDGHEQQYPVFIKLNESLPPTFEYSTIMSLTYKLKIKIYLKKSKTPSTAALNSASTTAAANDTTNRENSNADDSNATTTTTITTTDHLIDGTHKKKKTKSLQKLLGLRSTAISVFETPIIIGTMGRGIRVGDELRKYSEFDVDKDSDNSMPTPHFMKNVEYEDSLPKYEASRLPSYGDPSSRSIHDSIRSSRSSIVSGIIMSPATPSITSIRSFM